MQQQMDCCVDNGCSNLVAPTTLYKAAPSRHSTSSPEGVSLQKGEDEEAQGIGLNKTPRKKYVRRTKHRPSVIQEGTPMKSPRPVTPKNVENNEKLIPKRTYARKKKALNSTSSPPGITKENQEKPILVKTYARKRKALHLNSSDVCSVKIGKVSAPFSSTDVKIIDQLPRDETKSVRRSLNFSSGDETTTRCHVTTDSDGEPVPWKTLHGGATVCNTEFKGDLTLGLEVVVTKSPSEIAFDLNRSLTQGLNEYIRLPENLDPTLSAHSSRRETIREHLQCSGSSKDAENNMDTQIDHDKIDPTCSHPEIILIADDTEKSRTKEKYDHTSAEAQWTMTHINRFQQSEPMQSIDPVQRPTRKRSKVANRACKPTLLVCVEDPNALIPYAGSSMMVLYGTFPDTSKKQHTRAKVDLDRETNRVWNLLMGKKKNVEADGVDMDKERRWEEERKVYRGRADAFIDRMHLILGNRRFSKWKGSVVDSVVGAFLTQNVADHLSSSAFTSLAARFPLRSGGNCKKANEETMIASKEQDGLIMQTHTIKCQENKPTPETKFPSSTGPHGKGKEADNYRISFGDENKYELAYCEGNCLQFMGREPQIGTELPQNWMRTSASATRILMMEESESRMIMGDVFLMHRSFSLLEASSEFLNRTAGQAALCSGAATLMKDLVIRSKCSNSDNPTLFMNHSQLRDTGISHESCNNGNGGMFSAENKGAGDHEVACIKIEKKTEPSEKSWGPGSACPYANTPNILANHLPNNFEHVSSASYMSQLIRNPVHAQPIGTGNTDVVRGVGSFLPSAAIEIASTYDISIIEGSGTDWGTLLNSMDIMANKSHVSKSMPRMQTPSCSETQPCLKKHAVCHDIIPTKKIEKPSRNIHYELSYVYDEQLVEVQHLHADEDFPAGKAHHEVDIPTEIQNCGEQIEDQRSSNDSKETLENATTVQLNLKDKRYSSHDVKPERKESASQSKKTDAEIENMFDWEDLRKGAFTNGAKSDRTIDTMDSLDWDAVRNADVNEIAETIRERGMHNVIAERIKGFLNRLVKDHDSIDLEWLRNVPPDKAKDYLLSIHGLGLKSVECVRLLTLHQPAFPVDTNVARICVRLGWVPLQPLPESLQLHLLEL